MINVERDTYHKLVELLTPILDDQETRYAITYPAIYKSIVFDDVDFSGSAQVFTLRLVAQLINYDDYASLLALLEESKSYLGQEKQAQVQHFIEEFSDFHDESIGLVGDNISPKRTVQDWILIIITSLTVLVGIIWLTSAVLSSRPIAEPLIASIGSLIALIAIFRLGEE